jgi:hypothetical protein
MSDFLGLDQARFFGTCDASTPERQVFPSVAAAQLSDRYRKGDKAEANQTRSPKNDLRTVVQAITNEDGRHRDKSADPETDRIALGLHRTKIADGGGVLQSKSLTPPGHGNRSSVH